MGNQQQATDIRPGEVIQRAEVDGLAVVRVGRKFAVRWTGGTLSELMTEPAAIARMELAVALRARQRAGRMMRRRSWPMAPIKDKVTRPRLVHGMPGRLETWGATTADGQWGFDREDGEADTPWYGYHMPSRADGSCKDSVISGGTLRELRIQVALGEADQALAELKAAKAAA